MAAISPRLANSRDGGGIGTLGVREHGRLRVEVVAVGSESEVGLDRLLLGD